MLFRSVEYLGIIVGDGQVKMDPIKVKGLTDWPIPTTVKELRSFLGFGNYYKDFIQNYSYLARPLHELTRKNVQWNWGNAQDTAFNTLKKRFTSYLVLRNPDPTKQYIVDTDTSAFALGATISQDFTDGCHPIAYFSKSLLPAERNYDIYNRKLLAIISALRAFRHLLLGAQRKFLIRSDHNNLKYFKSPQKITGRQARWYELLQDYNFELQHFPGKSNTIADLLSRRKDFEGGVNPNENVIIFPSYLFKEENTPPEESETSNAHKIYLKDDIET